jgi:hypothetical protein
MKKLFATAALGLLGLLLFAQEQDHGHTPAGAAAQGELGAATEAMSHHLEDHEHMGAHMHMTVLRKAQPGDAARAQQVADQARQALEHYRDYQVALNEGFRSFLPKWVQADRRHVHRAVPLQGRAAE